MPVWSMSAPLRTTDIIYGKAACIRELVRFLEASAVHNLRLVALGLPTSTSILLFTAQSMQDPLAVVS